MATSARWWRYMVLRRMSRPQSLPCEWKRARLNGTWPIWPAGRKGRRTVSWYSRTTWRGKASSYIDSTEACRLDAASAIEEDKVILPEISCDVNLRRFGSDPQQRHAVRIVAGWREANDTVSLSDCHWNWRGTKIFKIGDDRIHFDCM